MKKPTITINIKYLIKNVSIENEKNLSPLVESALKSVLDVAESNASLKEKILATQHHDLENLDALFLSKDDSVLVDTPEKHQENDYLKPVPSPQSATSHDD